MDNLPGYLQYGEQTATPSRSIIYSTGDPVDDKPVFYIIAGLIKVEYPLSNSIFTLWMPEAPMILSYTGKMAPLRI